VRRTGSPAAAVARHGLKPAGAAQWCPAMPQNLLPPPGRAGERTSTRAPSDSSGIAAAQQTLGKPRIDRSRSLRTGANLRVGPHSGRRRSGSSRSGLPRATGLSLGCERVPLMQMRRLRRMAPSSNRKVPAQDPVERVGRTPRDRCWSAMTAWPASISTPLRLRHLPPEPPPRQARTALTEPDAPGSPGTPDATGRTTDRPGGRKQSATLQASNPPPDRQTIAPQHHHRESSRTCDNRATLLLLSAAWIQPPPLDPGDRSRRSG